MRRSLARVQVCALVTVLTAALGGCGLVDKLGGSGGSTPRSSSAASSEPPPSGSAPGLARFYSQTLAWSSCEGGECAQMLVPRDYAAPEGDTLSIAVLRVPAKSGTPEGSIVVNPGGPGGSGVEYARYATSGYVVSPAVQRRFDVVGFDPRGVGRSSAMKCLAPERLDAFFAQDPTPDDATEQAEAVAFAREFGRGCAVNSPGLFGHISTVEAARDMDILRSRLGDAKLNYLGKSYGTLLGATYAGLFPTMVGRMVIDGALPPDLTSEDVNRGQAEGFERATKAWAQDCVDQGNCPLGTSVDEVMQGLRTFLADIDQKPITRTGDPSVPAVTEGWASYAVAAAMYDQGSWEMLTTALRKAKAGDGAQLLTLANTYTDRNPGGGYSGNMQEAFYAITCLDKGESPSLTVREEQAAQISRTAPTFGALLVWSSLPCGYWPRPASAPQGPQKITAAGAAPIVVIGTTRDPATPYEWAQRMADQLETGVLLTYDGDGHTAYLRSNSCIDNAVDAYYLKGTVPEDGLKC